MADKAQALHNFWSSFDIMAIDEQSAYDTATLDELNIVYPYITYEVATDEFDEPVAIGADIWDNSTSWARIEQKASQIADAIGRGGVMQPYTGGAVWITRGTPFAQRMAAQDAASAGTGFDLRRIHININAEFLSA